MLNMYVYNLPNFKTWSGWPMFAVSKWKFSIQWIVNYMFLSAEWKAGDQNMFRILRLWSPHVTG